MLSVRGGVSALLMTLPGNVASGPWLVHSHHTEDAVRSAAALVHLGLTDLPRSIASLHELHDRINRVDQLLRQPDDIDAASRPLIVSECELDGQVLVVHIQQVVYHLVVELQLIP
jgi:hypothetical protein